jgi:hypothetical protein
MTQKNPFLDDFSPPNYGARRITLSLNRATKVPTANGTVIVDVDYSGAENEGGCVLPLEEVVQAPTIDGYSKRTHSVFPSQLTVRVLSAGEHMVVLRETSHNGFFGSLRFVAAGDPIDVPLAR